MGVSKFIIETIAFYAMVMGRSCCDVLEAKVYSLESPFNVLLGIMGSLSMFVKLFQ